MNDPLHKLLLIAAICLISSFFLQQACRERADSANDNTVSAAPVQSVDDDREGVEDFFNTFGDPRMRTGHIGQWIRRTPEADTMGRLSEISDEHAKGPISTFYISPNQIDHSDMEQVPGYDPKENYDYIYAYWKEDNSILVLYPPYNVEDVTYLSWAYSMRRIDLSKNIKKVGDRSWGENDVTSDEAERLLSLCVDYGVKIVIDKGNHWRNTPTPH